MTIMGSYPRKPSSQSNVPHKAYCLLSNGPQFAHVGVFDSMIETHHERVIAEIDYSAALLIIGY
jgi:hypothetical protein